MLMSVPKNPDRAATATIIRARLGRILAENVALIRRAQVPRIYESGVRYCSPATDESGQQHFLNALETHRQGVGTCPDLSLWRAAELRVLGDPSIGVFPCLVRGGRCVRHGPLVLEHGQQIPGCPNVKLYWREERPGIFHCEVRLPDGDAEDPSRFLGMGTKGIGA